MLASTQIKSYCIRVLVPQGDPLILSTPPKSLLSLTNLIAAKINADPETIRLTFRDSEGVRMMLVGEKRYHEALKMLETKVLQMTVVLVPITDSFISEKSHGQVRRVSVNTMSYKDTEMQPRKTLRKESIEPVSEIRKRVGLMVNNSLPYLSTKFKDFLYTLSTCIPTLIQEIDLSEAKIGCYECTLLAELIEFLPNLHSLNLQDNDIGTEGLTSLCSALLQNRSLEFLNLSNNNITSKGLKLLANTIKKLPKLELLSFIQNPVTREDIELLLDAAPAPCQIHHDINRSCQLM